MYALMTVVMNSAVRSDAAPEKVLFSLLLKMVALDAPELCYVSV